MLNLPKIGLPYLPPLIILLWFVVP